jgi:hypothetical protein
LLLELLNSQLEVLLVLKPVLVVATVHHHTNQKATHQAVVLVVLRLFSLLRRLELDSVASPVSIHFNND